MTGRVLPFRPWWEAPRGPPPNYRPSPAMAFAPRHLDVVGFPKSIGAAAADNGGAPSPEVTG